MPFATFVPNCITFLLQVKPFKKQFDTIFNLMESLQKLLNELFPLNLLRVNCWHNVPLPKYIVVYFLQRDFENIIIIPFKSLNLGNSHCCIIIKISGTTNKNVAEVLWNSDSVSLSVIPNSLRPHRLLPTRLPVHGVLQARILKWVSISFTRESSQPRDLTQVSSIAGRFFWATKKAH